MTAKIRLPEWSKEQRAVLLLRILERVRMGPDTDSCWEFTLSLSDRGYAPLTFEKRQYRVHRLTWALFVGPLDPEKDIDHLCLNRRCVNPFHLEQKSHKANIARISGPIGKNARKTLCELGHPLTPRSNGKGRICLECRRQYSRKNRRRRKNSKQAQRKYVA